MKQFLSLILCLGLMGLTAACGQTGEPDPEAVPAPEIVDSETIRSDPFAAYFDLSGMSQETLDGAIQDINQGDAHVQIIQTLADGQNLYVAFDVNWPQNADPLSEPIEAALTAGDTVSGGEIIHNQVADHTGSYIASFRGDFSSGQSLTLSLVILGQEYTFSWDAQNICQEVTANLEDSEGTVVGEATVTPFSLWFSIDGPYVSGIAHGDIIELLDETGTPLPETWSISGDPSAAFLEFFVPMELGTVKTLQVGPYTAHF